MYDAVTSTDNARALTFLDQWKILFGEVCGYDVDTPSSKLKKLAESYEIPTDDLTFVHKLVRGRDVSRWHWGSALHIILSQHPDKPSKAVPEVDLKRTFPKTHAYFKQFEEEIRNCALLAQFFDPASDPFYSSYNVGEYTYQRFKVVWKEVSEEVQAAVIDSNEEIIVPDHKLVMVSCQEENPAYFLSAVLNSSPIRLLVRSYATQTSISEHITQYARIPQYSPEDEIHIELAELAKKCHTLKAAGNATELTAAELEVDDLVARLWGTAPRGVGSIREAIQI